MTIRLDHTIVPAKDKRASAEFFAEIFGLTVKPGDGYFAQVQVNESLTFDFADEPEPPHRRENLHPPGRARLLLRGPVRPSAGSHDRSRDGELAAGPLAAREHVASVAKP